jgi:hypothetical protein
MKTIDIYNKKGRFIGEMIHEGEMANKKHLIETKLGYYKNKLLKVKIVTDEEFAIQFTGEGENIRKIERFTKPIFKKFKISKDKDNFYLDIKYNTYGTCPIIGSHIHHFIWLNDWIVFYKSEQSSTQTEVKVIPDEPFKKHYEVVL